MLWHVARLMCGSTLSLHLAATTTEGSAAAYVKSRAIREAWQKDTLLYELMHHSDPDGLQRDILANFMHGVAAPNLTIERGTAA